MSTLADVLTFAGVPERISDPSVETFVTVKLNCGGAVRRNIADGKTPVAFTGYRVQAGQFIYSRIDARNGAFAVLPTELSGSVVSKDFPIFEVNRDSVSPSYLNHFFRAGRLQRQILASSTGATNRQRITEERFLSFEIPLPPLPEQRRIAAILDHADALRAKRREVLAHLDALPQAEFHEMFGSAEFERITASELMPEMRNGLSPSTAGTYAAHVLTLSAVTRGAFDPDAIKAGAFTINPPADKRVTSRDFLICRGNGNKSLVGIGTYSQVDRIDLVFPDTVIAGRVDPTKVSLPFLDAAWRRREVRKQIDSVARTTNGTFKVNQQTLGGIMITVPPLALQQEFADRISNINTQRTTAQRALAAADELFASLQSRSFVGDL